MKFAVSILALCASLMTFGQVETSDSDVKLIKHYSDSTQVNVSEIESPSYPGGYWALFSFIEEQIVYPESALEEGTEGVIFLEFKVHTDGTLSNIHVIRGLGSGCDEEAIRVAGLMPQWSPGLKNGEPVAMDHRLPIRFRLPQDKG